jgi:hypothetical protein
MASRIRRAWALLATSWVFAVAFISSTSAEAKDYEKVQILDPYIELHTAAGRGYPIFYVIERDEWVEILMRRTDWFKIRSANGKEGWAHRSQLENTLTEYGAKKTFRDVLLDDYLSRRLELGFSWGHFESDPVLKAWGGYRVADTLSVELTVFQVQGVYSGTSGWYVDFMAQPLADKRLSPFFGIGTGMFNNIPKSTLVSAIRTDGPFISATVGARFYLTDRFLVRGDYAKYVAHIDESRTQEYRAATLGLSFFF